MGAPHGASRAMNVMDLWRLNALWRSQYDESGWTAVHILRSNSLACLKSENGSLDK